MVSFMVTAVVIPGVCQTESSDTRPSSVVVVTSTLKKCRREAQTKSFYGNMRYKFLRLTQHIWL